MGFSRDPKSWSSSPYSPGTGYRCGYVAVPKTHLCFGCCYNDPDIEINIEVHGGLTFDGPLELPGLPVLTDLWWFGFDCAHYGDAPDITLNPDADQFQCFPGKGHVWTLEEVTRECESLSKQLSRF